MNYISLMEIIFEGLTGDGLKDSEEMAKDLEMLKTSQIRSIRKCPVSIEGEMPE